MFNKIKIKMKVLNILLISYLLINITAQNSFVGSYIFSSAWATGGEVIDVNCLPLSAEFSNSYSLTWKVENRSECHDSHLLLHASTKCRFKKYVSIGDFPDVYVCGRITQYTYTFFRVEFLPNNSMIAGYVNNINPFATYPELLTYNYLFIANFSSYTEANYTYLDDNTLQLQAAYDMLDLESDYYQLDEDSQIANETDQDIIGYDMLDNITLVERGLISRTKDDTLDSKYLAYVDQFLQQLKNNSLSLPLSNLSLAY